MKALSSFIPHPSSFLYPTRQMKHLRYSVSGQVAETGWSGAAPRVSSTCRSRRAVWATLCSIIKKSSRLTCPEQLHVTRMPSGSSTSSPRRLRR